MPNKNLKSLDAGWRAVADRMAKLKMPSLHVELMRAVFFAGASFTLEQIERIGQPDITDEEALEWRAQADDQIAAVVIHGIMAVHKLPGASN